MNAKTAVSTAFAAYSSKRTTVGKMCADGFVNVGFGVAAFSVPTQRGVMK